MSTGTIGRCRASHSSNGRSKKTQRRKDFMSELRELAVGVMFWAGRDPLTTIREMKALGAECGQLGLPGDLPLVGAAQGWKEAMDAEQFPIVTVFCSYTGEDYADIPTVA